MSQTNAIDDQDSKSLVTCQTNEPGSGEPNGSSSAVTVKAISKQTFTICTTLSFCSSMPSTESVDAPLWSFPNQVLRGIQFHVLKRPGNFADFCRAVGTNCLIQLYGGESLERMSDISNETVLVASISDEYTKDTISGLGNTVIKANGIEEMAQLGLGGKTNPIRKSAFLPFKWHEHHVRGRENVHLQDKDDCSMPAKCQRAKPLDKRSNCDIVRSLLFRKAGSINGGIKADLFNTVVDEYNTKFPTLSQQNLDTVKGIFRRMDIDKQFARLSGKFGLDHEMLGNLKEFKKCEM